MDVGQINILPQDPGVYIFRNSRKKILYIGRATNLRSRVRSYLASDLLRRRGPIIVEAVENTSNVEGRVTDSVLEALLLEAVLIKKHQPQYNSKEKSGTSFLFVVVTKERFPRVTIVRQSDLESSTDPHTIKYFFGPFPLGGQLRDAMRIIRKIFPFRDRCIIPEKGKEGRLCFNAQLGLCPGVCARKMSQREYAGRIRTIALFMSGKKNAAVNHLMRQMRLVTKKQEFEKANSLKHTLQSLRHIRDVGLIKRDVLQQEDEFRIEGYDISHTAGSELVGVMCVAVNGEMCPHEYRKFIIRNAIPGDDVGALAEMLSRRLGHREWGFPDLVVVDGGRGQYNRAVSLITERGLSIPVVGVVKDERHQPQSIIGSVVHRRKHEDIILKINAESHRHAISWHRKRRDAVNLKTP